MSSPDPDLQRTPTLRRLLDATRGRLARQVWAYGIGTVLGAATLWIVFAFLADWGLRVPHPVRVLHGIALAVVIALFAWRDLVRPLAKLPGREGLALLFERAHPELREVLISSVQFQTRAPAADADPELVAAVVAEAERRAAGLEPATVIDPEAPRARLLLGLGGVACLALGAYLNPLHARTFLERMFGAGSPWPQRTHLVLEIPGLEADAVVERTPELLRLRLARGTDVPVLVTAEGETPDDVTLHFVGGREIGLTPTGGKVFRTLLQSCQEDASFFVTGGDDDSGHPRVSIEVLEPPDVEGLAIRIEPPAYSGMAPSLVFNQDVEVLRGSHVRVHVLPSPASATGQVRFLPDDRVQSLTVEPFPADEAHPGEDALRAGLACDLEVERTLGFRIELTDTNGLGNPEPGLYRIRVIEDRPPELTVLAPARGDFETIRGGAVPLRVRVEDDFALAALRWRVTRGDANPDESVAEADMSLERPPAEALRTGGSRLARDVAVGRARLEVDALGTAEAPVSVDARFELTFLARDSRAPEPNEGRSAPIRVRIVTPEELLRRLQDRLAAARASARKLADAQHDKRRRIEELLDAMEGDAAVATSESLALSAALAGERRVLADAQALARDLAAAAEDVLYARLDDKAAGLLEFHDARAARALDARFQPEPWRDMARELAGGRLGNEGFAATLVKLVDLALTISEERVTACVQHLDAAERGTTHAAVASDLQAAAEQALLVEARIEELMAQLAEWDNFQNVLTLAREILNRQKALRERTQQFATEK